MRWPLALLTGVWAQVSMGQVPADAVVSPWTVSLPAFGPNLALYSLPSRDDGGVVTLAEWRFSPTRDGGAVRSGPGTNFYYLYLPAYSWLTAQLPQCQSVSFAVQFSNDAGASAWSPSISLPYDSIAPPSTTGAVTTPATTWGAGLSFAPVVDDCGGPVNYRVRWRRTLDGGAGEDLDQLAPTISPARLFMGPGTWLVDLAPQDPAKNSAAFTDLTGQVTVTPDPAAVSPIDVRLDCGPWCNNGAPHVQWTAVPGASEYVVMLSRADGGTPIWVKHLAYTLGVVYPGVGNEWMRVEVAAVMADGGVSAWAAAATDLYMDLTPPTTPGAPQLVGEDAGVLSLGWSASSDTESGVARYELVGALGAGPFATLSSPASPSAQVPTVDGDWVFRVRAIDNAGSASAFSPATALFVDWSAPPVPAAPDVLVDGQSVQVWWGPVLDTPDASTPVIYDLQRAAELDTTWSPATGELAVAAHLDAPGAGDWRYRVRARDALGHASDFSAPSAVASVHADTAAPARSRYAVGCGCTSTGIGELPWGLVALLLWRRSRRVSSPGADRSALAS